MEMIKDDIFIDKDFIFTSMSPKLFTTFTLLENLEATIQDITEKYTVLFGKIFVLEIEGKEEVICTYNVDSFNISNNVLPNTILLHRKKETNTLYSINSLNVLVQSLNGGRIDNGFPIEWSDYQNSILLVSDGELKIFPTTIHKVFHLN